MKPFTLNMTCMANWWLMFRSKQYVLNNLRVFAIEGEWKGQGKLFKIWSTLIYRLCHDYVEIVDGPKFYYPKSSDVDTSSNRGFGSFRNYVKSQESDVKIFVPREFFDYV